MLSMSAVFLLVAFSMQWQERGMIIRAGLIAAVMKSISPSAVILGPMVGIIMEAVILETIILLVGRNLIGYALGGILAVVWALVQKILSLLIIYGFDLVRIAEAFYLFLVKTTGLENLLPIYLVFLVLGLYVIAGISAALSAYYSYKRMKKRNGKSDGPGEFILDGKNPIILQAEMQTYAGINLLSILLLMGLVLFFLNRQIYVPALSGGVLLIGYVLIRYQRVVLYLKKSSLWIQLFTITFVATLAWDWINTGNLFTVTGLIIGLEINFRALVIIFGFTGISVELRNPVVRSLLYRNGFSNLYKSVSLAFTTLPGIMEMLPRTKGYFRKRTSLLDRFLGMADVLHTHISRETEMHHNIFILTGKVHGGKSGFIKDFVKECRKNDLMVEGILATGTFKEGQRDTFTMTRIRNEESYELADLEKKQGWVRFHRFYFNPAAFDRGLEIIHQGLAEPYDVLILDEIGPMELGGKGWHKALQILDRDYSVPQVWVVREKILGELMDQWNIPVQNVVHLEKDTPEAMVQMVLNFRKR
jgi:nucleoside-triphosphatase THEP1